MHILQVLHELRKFVTKHQPRSICNYITKLTQIKNIVRSKDVSGSALDAPTGFNYPDQPHNSYTIAGH